MKLKLLPFQQVDGDIFFLKELPENARKLRGLVWRDERIKSKDDIFHPKKTRTMKN
jgi:hypothetical protein